MKGVIVDLRFNIGGNSNNGYFVISRFIDQALPASRWKSLSYVPAQKSWGKEPTWFSGDEQTIDPAEGKKFLGPLVVLVGPNTYSSAEDFCVPLKYSGRAVLVGQKTGGSTGNPISGRLPGGGSYLVVSKRDTFPDGKEFVGIGIEPDVEIRPTVSDIVQGTDRAVEKGIEVIRNWPMYRPNSAKR